MQKLLDQRNIKDTLRYMQLLTLLQDGEYVCKASKTFEDSEELMGARFQYVTDVTDAELFRKLKTSYLGN